MPNYLCRPPRGLETFIVQQAQWPLILNRTLKCSCEGFKSSSDPIVTEASLGHVRSASQST